LFHTVEGGCIIPKNEEIARKILLYRSFGHIGDEYFSVGINGKNSEFHAAMGLAILPKIKDIIGERKEIFGIYISHLPPGVLRLAHELDDFEYNYAYFPVILESEELLLKVKEALAKKEINVRRYFYPSLNLLPQMICFTASCPISEDVSKRVMCLPLYVGLSEVEIENICRIIKEAIR
jgi:dTDP-4-amino-4,6-dideoxygalactose transaminase